MSAFSKAVWDQLKNKTVEEIAKALAKDGWVREETRGATQGYRNQQKKRVVLHYHRNGTKGPKLLRGLVNDIGWTEDDLRRLKLIKGKSRREAHGQEAPSRPPTGKEDAASDTRLP